MHALSACLLVSYLMLARVLRPTSKETTGRRAVIKHSRGSPASNFTRASALRPPTKRFGPWVTSPTFIDRSAKHFVTDQRTIDAALNLASALLSADETEEAQKFCRETLRKLKRGCPPNDARVVTCVEINQCVGCGRT